ncbi:MAG: hypothetical protein HOQ05_11690 [Corynebacteriales bacterium]|nr:hypothetical protein [Mycobacteriales bacterium]
MSSLNVVLVCLIGAFALAIMVGLWVHWRFREHSNALGAHSHNDYEQQYPLTLALRQGFISVEADVWPVDDQLLVGHEESDLHWDASLRDSYLLPLAELVRARGHVLAGLREPFQLLVDFKANPERTYLLLDEQLRAFPGLFTYYEREKMRAGPVSVVVSGNYPRELIAEQKVRFVACDGRFADVGTGISASLVPLCSESWRDHFRWRGHGVMPSEEKRELHRLVRLAHEDGRKVRFWGAPRWPAYARRAVWRELADAHVDYLGADNLVALRRWGKKMN